jgi:hypothetical protein
VPLPTPEAGLVICYAYLWRDEHERGREEGLKDRPCAIVLTTERANGETIVTVAPITHSPPTVPDDAVEIPSSTKARLGLDGARSWIVVTEVNRFAWPGSDLRPVSRDKVDRFDFGLLPPSIFRQVQERLAVCAKAQRLKTVHRTE